MNCAGDAIIAKLMRSTCSRCWEDCIKVQEKKKKLIALWSRPPQNVKLGIFTSQSCSDWKSLRKLTGLMFPSRFYITVTDPGEEPGGPGPPFIFRPNWGPKGRKNICFGDPLPYLRVWMTAPPLLISSSGSGAVLLSWSYEGLVCFPRTDY